MPAHIDARGRASLRKDHGAAVGALGSVRCPTLMPATDVSVVLRA